jgi:Ca-activated chloride channel family protein
MSGRGLGRWILVSFLSFSSFLSGAFADGERTVLQQLRDWAEDLDLLATDREKNLFSSLQGDSERQMFIQQFWQARDPFPQTSRNEAREQWESRLAEARKRWRNLGDERARVYMLRGEPTSWFSSQCPSGPMEVWTYEPGYREKYRTVLVFLPSEGGPMRLWRPGTLPDVTTITAETCSNPEKLSQESKWIRWTGKDQYGALIERALARPRPREWVSTFRTVSVDSAGTTEQLDGDMAVELAGLQRNKVVVRVMMLVSPQSLPTGNISSAGPEFAIAGQVLRGGQPFETFLYRLHARPAGGGIPLAFERYLEPGEYALRVRVEHVESGKALVAEREIDVPQLQRAALEKPAPEAPQPMTPTAPAVVEAALKSEPAPAAPVKPLAPEIRSALAEADAVLPDQVTRLSLVSPSGSLLIGNVRFPVLVEQAADTPAAERIERVAFTLDGKPLMTRNHPPFDLTLDLGGVPRPRKLRAEGLDSTGAVVARDELLINAGAQDFRVRLLEPRPGRAYRQSVRVLADVTPPVGASIERVELWFGEDRIATIYQPPYSLPFVLPAEGETGYLRAVAYLAGGGSSEDVVFINTPVEPDQLDVHMVELYATVMDHQGRPLTTVLDPSSIVVLENGARQQIRQIEQVADTPVRLVTLIDSSASMVPQMGQTRQAAMDFLHSLLRPHDQAAVIAFNTRPQVTVPLTSDLGQLDEGLKSILAESDTSLYDSLAYSLLYLTKSSGQRAVLLLSDGQDRTSRLGFDQTLEVAQRTGIAVYTIGLGLEGGAKGDAAQRLHRLASVTGGRSFFAKDASELAGVYSQIEKDLRAQYRIAYQSSNTGTDGAFRTVQLQMAKEGGLEARTISGYYP